MKIIKPKFKISKTFKGWVIYFDNQPLTLCFSTKKEAVNAIKFLRG